jgi:hypothetical protein
VYDDWDGGGGGGNESQFPVTFLCIKFADVFVYKKYEMRCSCNTKRDVLHEG